MAREGAALAERIMRRFSNIDLVLIHGYGFPRLEGGPMWALRDATCVQALESARRPRAI